MVDAIIAKYKPRLDGKRVMLYVGGLRPRHVIGAYEDLGMEVIGTGYEFGHNDDYDRTIKEMGNATLLYDDVTGFEFEEFVKRIKPDLVGSGIKEKYIFQKMGVPLPPDALLGLLRPVPRLRRFCHLRPRHGHDHQQPVLEEAPGALAEEAGSRSGNGEGRVRKPSCRRKASRAPGPRPAPGRRTRSTYARVRRLAARARR
jgi:hypothetical protein